MEDFRKIRIWKILIYFIIYSVAGFLIETIYAVFTKGMLESRKSFLYGPFCAIYGVAAVCMILFLQPYKKNYLKMFVLGSLIGLTIEYVFSFWGEIIFNARWWDYSNNLFNINGRICIFYAVIWGFLAWFLIYTIHPILEKKLNFLKIENNKTKYMKILTVIILTFLIIDAMITSYAVKNFIHNVAFNYGIEIRNLECKNYQENLFTRYFSNEKMIMIYPNISVITKNNEIVYLGSVLHGYKNYYYIFENIK